MSLPSKPVDDRWSEPQGVDDVAPLPSRPAGSPIEINRFDDGISITVPPAGLWRGSKGLFFFGLLWCGFMTVFTAVMLGAGAFSDIEANIWLVLLFVALFWLVGIGLLLGGINMGKRQAGLAVAGGTLMILQTGLFGKKQREWPLSDLSSIHVGPSGMEVNGVPVLQLQIHDADGKQVGLLAGRSDEELEWLAHELRTAAQLQG
jgi:hypothetical protein